MPPACRAVLITLLAVLAGCGSSSGPPLSNVPRALTIVQLPLAPTYLNNRGDMAGELGIGTGLVQNGQIVDLGTASGAWCYPTGMNNNGDVVGNTFMVPPDYVESSAVLWRHNTARLLRGFGGATWANAVNDAGQVVGYADLPDGLTRHALMWDGDTLIDIGTLPGDTSAGALAINSSGTVLCESAVYTRYFTWHAGLRREVKPIGLSRFDLLDINDSGTMLGVANGRAFTLSNSTVAYIGDAAMPMNPEALNNAGQVVGSQRLPDGRSIAVLYTNGRIWDLNQLVIPSPTTPLSSANAINDSGQILAGGLLLTPKDRSTVGARSR